MFYSVQKDDVIFYLYLPNITTASSKSATNAHFVQTFNTQDIEFKFFSPNCEQRRKV